VTAGSDFDHFMSRPVGQVYERYPKPNSSQRRFRVRWLGVHDERRVNGGFAVGSAGMPHYCHHRLSDKFKMRQKESPIMFTTLKTASIAGLIGLTTLAAVPASADSMYLGFGDRGDDTRFGVYIGEEGAPRYERDRARRSEARCSPDRALDKAERMGVRRARIDFVTERRIGVIGRSRGDRVAVTFARAPGCPVIG
jgi:hypothetical protein